MDALNDPDMREQLNRRNIPLADPKEAFTMESKLKSDHVKWSALVKAANILLE